MYVRILPGTFDFSAIDQTFDIHDTGARWLLSSLLTA